MRSLLAPTWRTTTWQLDPTAGRTHDDDAPEEEAAVLVHPHGDLRRTLDLGPVRSVVRRRLGRAGGHG